MPPRLLATDEVEALFQALRRRGPVFGPAAGLDSGARPPPAGRLTPLRYAPLERACDAVLAPAAFGYPAKRLWFRPSVTLAAARRAVPASGPGPWEPGPPPAGAAPPLNPDPARPFAVWGVRGCDLAALERLDAVLMTGPVTDPEYAARRRAGTVVAFTCTQAGPACFCTATGGSPVPAGGCDLVVTPLAGGPGGNGAREYLVEPRSARGEALVEEVGGRPAGRAAVAAAAAVIGSVRAALPRSLNGRLRPENAAQKAARRLDSPAWDELAGRCLGCAACSLTCPTCPCFDVVERVSATADAGWRERRWTSCLVPDFGRLASHNARARRENRLKHWLLHKLAPAEKVTGGLTCVGCGRCSTWCPAGLGLRAALESLEGEGGLP